MKVGYKVWLDNDGKVFGDGPCELLRRVEKMMSLHRAANQMGMSYSKAWRLIQTLEERLGFPLLERKVGGQSGGGSLVTPQARNLMNHYEGFRKDVGTSLKKIYRRHFQGSIVNPNESGEGKKRKSD
ncbi:MAG: winged helix-turn-helix domain-containing protein [Thermodesulfobacteriota bacterium]